MNTTTITLYKNHKNNIGWWSIRVLDYLIIIEHSSTIGGDPIRHTERVPEGKAGRTRREQVISRVKSRINKQLDKGYVKTYEEALTPPTNASNLPQPMLAQRIDRIKNISDDLYWQYKYDGHRCLIRVEDEGFTAYSRQGKLITSIGHILNELIPLNLPVGTTLDGELYCHGVPLQTLASWIKRKQENTSKLKYVVYDQITDDPFQNRFNNLLDLTTGSNRENFILATTSRLPNDQDISNRLKFAKKCGYEGLIIRQNNKGYEPGRRSNSLLKVKSCLDNEFMVVNISASKDGWAILTCINDAGHTFKVSAPGTIEEKRRVLENASYYIGKLVTVEYANLTNKGVPFHGVALRFRDE